MKAYLEELQKQAGVDKEKTAAPSGAAQILEKVGAAGKAKIDAPARTELSTKKKVLGYEQNQEQAIYPMPPLTLTSILSATKLPSTKPSYEKVLLPNSDVSPTIGIGMGGLQMRVRVKRRPEGVPKGTIVGMGLDNQSGTGGAADISLKPKTSGALSRLLGSRGAAASSKKATSSPLEAALRSIREGTSSGTETLLKPKLTAAKSGGGTPLEEALKVLKT